ncbi:hypothetical protein AAC387_Pa06g1205 [Persea americana]
MFYSSTQEITHSHQAIPEGDEIFCKYIVFAISEILQRISGAESCIFSWWRLFEKSLPQEVDPTPLTQRFQPGKCCKLFDSEISHQWTHKTSNHALIRWNSTNVEETHGPCHLFNS